MISRYDISRVLAIIDREAALIELKHQGGPKKRKLLGDYRFVRETFTELCLDCLKAEGTFTAEDIEKFRKRLNISIMGVNSG